ncbi:MAG: hypothetical protein AAFV90_26525 [Cyanobacteria bacterium J06634_5]
MADFDFSPEEIARQVDTERDEIALELEESRNDSYAAADELMSAIDYESPDIFTPPENVPALTQAEHNELTQIVSGQTRAWDIAKGVAKNAQSAAEVEGIYANVGLIDARTAVTREQTVNEGLRLIEVSETGKLISARTEGVVIATQLQGLKNEAGRQMVVLEADRTQALLDSTVADINAIRSSTEAKLLEAEGKYLKSAGTPSPYDFRQSLN